MNNILAIITLILTVAFAVAPLFSGDFSGFASDLLPVPQINPPVQPAGYAFAIWGPIYLWLIASAIYGLIYKARDPGWDAARVPLCISLAVGVPWLVIAQVSVIWATITIFIMAFSAIAALHRTPSLDRWWMRGPVALYAGWLTAASFVSLATTMAGYGIGFDAMGWAIAGIIGALALTVATFRRTNSPLYIYAVVWALVGICAANGVENFLITALAITGIVSLICVMAMQPPRQPRIL
jgi:hypothetical protein